MRWALFSNCKDLGSMLDFRVDTLTSRSGWTGKYTKVDGLEAKGKKNICRVARKRRVRGSGGRNTLLPATTICYSFRCCLHPFAPARQKAFGLRSVMTRTLSAVYLVRGIDGDNDSG